MREIVHIQGGQCGNQIGAKVRELLRPTIRPKHFSVTVVTLDSLAAACGCYVVVAVQPAQHDFIVRSRLLEAGPHVAFDDRECLVSLNGIPALAVLGGDQ